MIRAVGRLAAANRDPRRIRRFGASRAARRRSANSATVGDSNSALISISTPHRSTTAPAPAPPAAISAQTEVMVERANPRQIEELRKDRRNQRFLVVSRCDIVGAKIVREPVPQGAAAHLAHRIPGDLVDQHDRARDLEWQQVLQRIGPQCLHRRRPGLMEHDGRDDILSKRRMRHGKGCGFPHGGVLHEGQIGLRRRNLDPAAVDGSRRRPVMNK
jgi:hypothetical protein